MVFLIYNILLTFSLLLASPYFLLRALIQKRFRKELAQRMGFLPAFSHKKPIWIHAASVGEVFCSVPLLQRIKREFPQRPIVLTTMTRTGNERAKTIPEANLVFFLPIDHPLFIRRAFRKIDPAPSLDCGDRTLAQFAPVLWKKRNSHRPLQWKDLPKVISALPPSQILFQRMPEIYLSLLNANGRGSNPNH